MSYGSNAAHDLAALREDQERTASIADASAALLVPGTKECVDCGHAIAVNRLAVAPFARRCVECQTAHEEENR